MIAFASFYTIGNRNEYSTKRVAYKLCHFNLTTSPLYLVKLKKIAQKRPTA